MWYAIFLGVLACYFLGNLNGAVCISTLTAHEDVRTHGSGNAGLTNFIRNYGTAKALLVVAIDAGKTVLGCLLMGQLLKPWSMDLDGRMLGGFVVTLGHIFPATLGFKGGKGIMCGAATALVVDWRLFLVLAAIFAVTVAMTRYVSLGSVLVAAGFAVSFLIVYWSRPVVAVSGTALAVLAIYMHRANLGRLMKGTENKFTFKGKRV